jgi:hypothetical protein
LLRYRIHLDLLPAFLQRTWSPSVNKPHNRRSCRRDGRSRTSPQRLSEGSSNRRRSVSPAGTPLRLLRRFETNFAFRQSEIADWGISRSRTASRLKHVSALADLRSAECVIVPAFAGVPINPANDYRLIRRTPDGSSSD